MLVRPKSRAKVKRLDIQRSESVFFPSSGDVEEHTLNLAADASNWSNTEMYKERMEELKRVEVGMKLVAEIAIAIVEENNHVPEITADFEAFQESAPFFATFIEEVNKYYKIEAQTRLLNSLKHKTSRSTNSSKEIQSR